MDMRGRPLLLAMVLAPTLCFSPVATAEPATEVSAATPVLTAATRDAALKAIKARLSRAYINPDRVPAILARLDTSKARYQTDDPARFAALITEDMQAVAKDTHLYVRFAPEWYRAATARPDPAAIAASNAFDAQHARNFNHGLVETRLLPGNIRYLKIVGFFWNEAETARAYDDAMRFLKGGRAIIIDLRSNQGGDTSALDYLRSHFFAPGTLMTTLVTPGSADVQVLAQPNLPSGPLTGIPLYVLINHRSRSAAEAFAYTIGQFNLGELVGQRTEGAAHFSDDTAVPPFFRFSVPLGYTQDPISKRDWEGTGVAPTIEVPAPEALETAYDLALARLLPLTPDGVEKDFLVWARDGLGAQRTDQVPTPAELAALAGQYGAATIELRGSALWLVRPDREPRQLKPLGAGGLFEAEDDDTFRVRIGHDGLYLLRPGSPLTLDYPR